MAFGPAAVPRPSLAVPAFGKRPGRLAANHPHTPKLSPRRAYRAAILTIAENTQGVFHQLHIIGKSRKQKWCRRFQRPPSRTALLIVRQASPIASIANSQGVLGATVAVLLLLYLAIYNHS